MNLQIWRRWPFGASLVLADACWATWAILAGGALGWILTISLAVLGLSVALEAGAAKQETVDTEGQMDWVAFAAGLTGLAVATYWGRGILWP